MPFPVAEVARLKKMRTRKTKTASFGKGSVWITMRAAPFVPISPTASDTLRPWKAILQSYFLLDTLGRRNLAVMR